MPNLPPPATPPLGFVNDIMYKPVGEDGLARALQQSQSTLLLFVGILLALFFFFKLLPEAKRKTHFLLWGMAFLASLPVFSVGIFLITDAEFHLIRIDALFEGLKSGQIPVRLSGIFNLNHGLPVNIFYGDLLLYFPAFLRLLGFPLSFAFKAYVFFIQLLGVYIAYFAFSRIFQKQTLAFLITFIYITAHFRLASFYMRTALGEFSAVTFLPLILLAFWNIYTPPKPVFETKNGLLLAIASFFILYSHVLTTLLTAICCALFALLFYKKTFTLPVLKTFLLGIIFTLLLGAAFWIPFVDYHFSTYTELRALTEGYRQFIQENGATLFHYFSFFHFGDLSNYANETKFSLTPGIVLMFTFFLVFYRLLFFKHTKRLKILFGSCAFLLWLSSLYFPWDFLTSIPLFSALGNLQVPWRFLSFTVLLLALLLGVFIEELPENLQKNAIAFAFFTALFGLTLLYANYEIKTRLSDVPNAYVLRNFTGGTVPENRVSGPEYLIYGTDLKQLSYTLRFQNAQGKMIGENGINLSLFIEKAGGNAFVEVPRFFYPYLEAFSQNALLETQMGNNNLMRILLPPNYQGSVYVRFLPPFFWRLAELCSLFTFLFLILFIFKRKKKMHNSTVNLSKL